MIGIVILNYQTWDLSCRCIKSIYQTCKNILFRIYLVDNGSWKPMPEAVHRFLSDRKEVFYIQAETNRGYAAGNNLGVKKALEDFCEAVIVTNNDIIFLEHAVFKMINSLSVSEKTGIVGPKVVDEKGRIQISHCSMKTGMREILQIYTIAKIVFRKKWKRYYCLDQNPETGAYVYHVSGCCFAMTQACAREMFPLDEGTFLYHEELILGRRMEQASYRTYYEPGSVVVHQHGATTKQMRPFMYQCICQSELYYCNRYLGAKKWQLWGLYQYRKILYWLRSRNNEQMKRYWKTYKTETKKNL